MIQHCSALFDFFNEEVVDEVEEEEEEDEDEWLFKAFECGIFSSSVPDDPLIYWELNLYGKTTLILFAR